MRRGWWVERRRLWRRQWRRKPSHLTFFPLVTIVIHPLQLKLSSDDFDTWDKPYLGSLVPWYSVSSFKILVLLNIEIVFKYSKSLYIVHLL